MVHLDDALSRRFTKSCGAAAFGYARAAQAAYAAFVEQAIDFWAAQSRSLNGESTAAERPHFQSGPHPFRAAYTPQREEPSPVPDFVRMTEAWAASPMLAPVRAWWSLFPLQGNPASWPMAHALMTAGVPRSVALPTAEANMAAMDAAQAATASVDRAFSAYRSEGGFAVSQIMGPKALYGAMFLAPFTTKFPWAA